MWNDIGAALAGRGGEKEHEGAGEGEEGAPQPALFGGLGARLQSMAASARDKSQGLLGEFRRDLAEFTGSVGKESQGLTQDAVANARRAGQRSAEAGKRVTSGLVAGTSGLVDKVRAAVRDASEREARLAASDAGRDAGGAADDAPPEPTPFERAVAAVQRDPSTYTDEPADAGSFAAWKDTFSVEGSDIDAVLEDNAFMAELQSRIVPLIVDRDTFWERYFFRVHRLREELQPAEEAATEETAATDEGAAMDPAAEGTSAQSNPLSPDADSIASSGQASASAHSTKSTDFMMVTATTAKPRPLPTIPPSPTTPAPPPEEEDAGGGADSADEDWATPGVAGQSQPADEYEDEEDEDWGEV